MRDIVENIERIESHIEGLDETAFLRSQMVIDAVERCLSRISEAAVKIGPDAATYFPDHDWIAIRAIGNRLRHDYDTITESMNWLIATQRLPGLKRDIVAFLSRFSEDQERISVV
ncbi:DUF86 domain-containing protein [Rhizobium sp. SG2393]|uniref:HepT-like ribonuclease domain-containing protein n=1 Tax=Rhizobium sp. SG2393 TaxID=3276279 RepID=UPI00366F3EEE